MESKSNQTISRWKKPNLYVTIVGLYLLSSLAIILSHSLYGYFSWFESLKDASSLAPGWAFVPLVVMGAPILLAFTSIPSLIGGIGLLLQRKFAAYVSLFALLVSAFGIFLSIGIISTNFKEFPFFVGDQIAGWLFISSLFVITGIMYCFLILGWKRVKW